MSGDDRATRSASGEPERPFVTALDEALSLALGARVGDGIDARDVAEAASLFRAMLADRFETLIRVGAVDADTLARRVAELQADVLMLKAAVERREDAPAALRPAYADPLALARALASGPASSPDAPPPGGGSATTPFDERVLCAGWSAPAADADGVRRRRIAPGPKASVVLPAFGPGAHRVEAACGPLDAAQARGLRVACLGGAVSNLAVGGGAVRFTAEMPPHHRGGFLFIEFEQAQEGDGDGVAVASFAVRHVPAVR
ncbi:hypothetical protein [Rubrimonas cliftonensis]|uniref:Uncharacterized protein n=1 Tax=Rubrimonas cliftonensis TaxID=89524 RepID=A0A1H4CY11_9RHOB|nr:hypothetical protein [Rubrimonas cliftonensis]SEA65220.1 hypothetical protein SAMN05444370_108101 [Rubrimonas cliftonensis]